MRKEDIDRHWDRERSLPAVNVKVYDFYPTPIVDVVMERWGISRDLAEKAVELAFEYNQGEFWGRWTEEEELGYYFPHSNVRVYQAGRMGGWLEVYGLKDLEYWDAIDVARWAKFQKAVKADVKYWTSEEAILERVDMNHYYLENSSLYNFTITPSGEDICLADARSDIIAYSMEKYGKVIHI